MFNLNPQLLKTCLLKILIYYTEACKWNSSDAAIECQQRWEIWFCTSENTTKSYKNMKFEDQLLQSIILPFHGLNLVGYIYQWNQRVLVS